MFLLEDLFRPYINQAHIHPNNRQRPGFELPGFLGPWPRPAPGLWCNVTLNDISALQYSDQTVVQFPNLDLPADTHYSRGQRKFAKIKNLISINNVTQSKNLGQRQSWNVYSHIIEHTRYNINDCAVLERMTNTCTRGQAERRQNVDPTHNFSFV